jgi:ferredoxin--NADP+ reductase
LSADHQNKHIVAVIGAGPAGLFAARQLAGDGVRVALLNRDVKPGGLAEYGIYPDKHKMKEGLRKQFRQILQMPGIDYYGNVTVSQEGDLTLDDLKAMGFQALLVSAGAQGTKWLGLPGEEIPMGVYHAKDIVYHYNKLPPFSQRPFHIGRRVALVGAGNVMLDIARWLIRTRKVEEVVAVVRRGPAEVKFDKKEMEYVVANLDQEALDEELVRCTPFMEAVGQDPQAAREFILSALPKSLEPVRQPVSLRLPGSPTRILCSQDGQTCAALEVEDTKLVPSNGDTKAKGLGTRRVIDTDTVIFCIGDKVDDAFGLPVQWNAFVKCPEPRYAVDEISYEAYDPEAGLPVEGVFVAGWSREASSGLVGIARKDGERGAKAVEQYLETQPPADEAATLDALRRWLQGLEKPVVEKGDIQRLEETEAKRPPLAGWRSSNTPPTKRCWRRWGWQKKRKNNERRLPAF